MEIIKSNLKFREPLTPLNLNKVDSIALHHMAHPTAGINEIHQWHLARYDTVNGKKQYWKGFGYGYWIDFDGNIYEGRGLNYNAAVNNQNGHIVSIGFQGDYDKAKTMPDKQYNAGIWLINYLKAKLPTVKVIDGHNHWNPTSCPGKYFPLAEMKRGESRMPKTTYKKILSVWPSLFTHVFELDPMALRAGLVSSAGPEIAKLKKNFINANFFSGTKTIGWLISEGKVLNDRHEYKSWIGNPKGTLIVYKDGRVEVGFMRDSEMNEAKDKIWFACQGFNLFPFYLQWEGWTDPSIARKTMRLSIGYNKTAGKVIIAVRSNSDATRAILTMKNLGCDGAAICLDSGGSVNAYFEDKKITATDRKLTNIIYF